jgi:hypothetical protein
MKHQSIEDFAATPEARGAKGPVAIVMAEDEVELTGTLERLLAFGFRPVLLLAPADLSLDEALAPRIHCITFDVFQENALQKAVNRISAALPEGIWLHYCYNAEYLFFPFCETRSARDLLSFHTEERRDAMLTYVIDLYAADLEQHTNAVSVADAHLDRSGYYALARKDPARNWEVLERQFDFFGGLRWRFEEHIPWTRRKIDRIALFRNRRGLELRPDFTFDDAEYNTVSCPWHHNLTAALCSFRTAKALRTNPGSRAAIRTFRWRNSARFSWHSQQLMDLGLIEPGQWF